MKKLTNPTLYINGRFLTQQVTGVQRYSREIITKMDMLISEGKIKPPENLDLICLVPNQTSYKPPWRNFKIQQIGFFKNNLWEQIDLPIKVQSNPLFSPANIGPLLSINQIATFHDTSVYAIPDAYSIFFRLKYKLIFKNVGKTAKWIITVSQFSKRELTKYCHIDSNKIIVIPHGHEHLKSTISDQSIISKYSLNEKPFFLVVGSQSPHKNLDVVFDANTFLDQDKYNIVVAGGSFSRVFQKTNEIINNNIVRVGYVTDKELKALYKKAISFIFPSLYEGFGLPVLESLSFGCPVICSSAASLSEFGPNLVTYFDPTNPNELSKIMESKLLGTGLKSPDYSQILDKYSWEKAAIQTWNIIEDLIN